VLNLQQRILAVFEPQESLPWKEVFHRLGNVERAALDVALNAMVRAQKLRLIGLRYRVDPPGQLSESQADQKSDRIPTALEEAAASLNVERLVCVDCQDSKAASEFQLLTNGKRLKHCNDCQGKRSSAGRQRARERRGAKASVDDYTNQGEVMNPPESAAQGSEARNLNTPTCDGTGAVPADRSKGGEEQSTQHSAAPSIVLNGSSGEKHDDERQAPKCDSPSAASSELTIADRVFERVKAQRQEALNKITLLQVEIANLKTVVAERDKFLEMYDRFAQGAT
jgi:hypothetical protein